jgi:voltage-gated potassium channel Kch
MISEMLIAFGMLLICLVIHVTGMVLVGDRLVRQREELETNAGPAQASILLIVIFSFVILLHLAEAFIWACFYFWQGLFENYETALYFSLKTYSTVGYGDVLMPQRWRLVATMEALSGVLLCGLSTAFLFAIINTLFRFRVAQLSKLSPRKLSRMPEIKDTSDALNYE